MKKKSINLSLLTKITTAATALLIFCCLGLTAKFVWSSLNSLSASDSSLVSSVKPEGIDSKLLEKVSTFRQMRKNRQSTSSGVVRDPFMTVEALSPPPAPTAPPTEQPTTEGQPAPEQPTEATPPPVEQPPTAEQPAPEQ